MGDLAYESGRMGMKRPHTVTYGMPWVRRETEIRIVWKTVNQFHWSFGLATAS